MLRKLTHLKLGLGLGQPGGRRVAAGTYHATIVDQTMAESFAGHRVTIEVRTWLAPGVGPVKSEVTGIGPSSPVAGPLVVEELKSFTK